jgi:hypothetical protein
MATQPQPKVFVDDDLIIVSVTLPATPKRARDEDVDPKDARPAKRRRPTPDAEKHFFIFVHDTSVQFFTCAFPSTDVTDWEAVKDIFHDARKELDGQACLDLVYLLMGDIDLDDIEEDRRDALKKFTDRIEELETYATFREVHACDVPIGTAFLALVFRL